MKLQEILDYMNKVYCGHCAIEYMHVPHDNERIYLKNKYEGIFSYEFTKEEKIKLYEDLVKAETFDDVLIKKFST